MGLERKSIDVPKIVKVSGDTVALLATQQVQISGQGTFLPASQVVKTSGEPTLKITTGTVLISGYGCTNALGYSGTSFNKYEAATFAIANIGGGSGIRYNVRGHVVQDINPYLVSSGEVYSGEVEAVSVTGAYEYVDIGVENLQDDFSGAVTVLLALR